MCYMEPNCVSINLGPLEGGKHKCDLNAADENQFANSLVSKPTFTYLAIEVNVIQKKGYFQLFSWFILYMYFQLKPLHSEVVLVLWAPSNWLFAMHGSNMMYIWTFLLPQPSQSFWNLVYWQIFRLQFSFGQQNPCSRGPCLNNGACQAGFTSKGYRCICRPGFTGAKCHEGIMNW